MGKDEFYTKGDVIGGKFEVRETLGKGGFGVVYLVYDRELQELVALKTFRDIAPSSAPTWARILSALEQAKGERRSAFANRHGDWCRDAALWLGRRAGRLRLAELGKLAGGFDYAVVSKAIARFGQRLALDYSLREQLARIQNQLSK